MLVGGPRRGLLECAYTVVSPMTCDALEKKYRPFDFDNIRMILIENAYSIFVSKPLIAMHDALEVAVHGYFCAHVLETDECTGHNVSNSLFVLVPFHRSM